jgi:hypothetical protein
MRAFILVVGARLGRKDHMKIKLLSVLFCLGAVALSHADPVITFDDLPGNFAPVPLGYHQLGWTNMDYLNGLTYPFNPSGFQPAAVSASNVIYNAGATASIGGDMFDFLSARVTSVFNDNEQLEAKGYLKGTLVYAQTNNLSATTSTLIQFNFYGVDRVDLTPSGGSQHPGYSGSGVYFAMDNVSVVTYVPYTPLPLSVNGGFENGSLSGWSYSGDTNNTTVVTAGQYVHSGNYGLQIGPITPGFVGQNVIPTDIGRAYTVSFALENVGGSSNIFDVTWGGFPVFGFTNKPAFGWTNIQFNVVASRPGEFLQFQFLNPPSFFGFDDLSVTPAVLVSNGGFETGDFSGWNHTGNTANDSVLAALPRAGTYAARFGAVGSPSFISQNVATQPGQPYLVSLWLQNLPGVISNEFHASWEGQSLANNTNLPAAGWTNLHYTVMGAAAQSALQFGLRNDPSYFFMDEVSVLPLPLVQNGGFEFGDFTGWTTSGNFTFSSVVSSNSNSGYYGGFFGPQATLGFLSQTVPTIPGQSYVIGFMLNNPGPMTNAEFRVSWNGIVLMDITNLFLAGWIPYEFIVPATGNSATLQFGFRDDPAYLGLDDVFVSPIATPAFTSMSKGSNSVMSLDVLAGYEYEVQYSTNLSQPNWTPLNGGFFFPGKTPISITDTNPPDPKRFYRAIMQPPPLIF